MAMHVVAAGAGASVGSLQSTNHQSAPAAGPLHWREVDPSALTMRRTVTCPEAGCVGSFRLEGGFTSCAIPFSVVAKLASHTEDSSTSAPPPCSAVESSFMRVPLLFPWQVLGSPAVVQPQSP